MSKPETFKTIEKWFDEINKVTSSVCKVLVGNKCDLIDPMVNIDQARELANKYEAKFILASALDNKNVSEIYSTLALGNKIMK
jgi:Ras-related protein Rab-8A